MDLIDRESLMRKIANHNVKDTMRKLSLEKIMAFEWTKYDIYKYIKSAPQIEHAVTIIRCKDCDNRGSICCPMYFETNIDNDCNNWDIVDMTEDNGFCHNGTPKEE